MGKTGTFEVKPANAKNVSTAAKHKTQWTPHTTKLMDATTSLDATSKFPAELSHTIALTDAAVSQCTKEAGQDIIAGSSSGSAGNPSTDEISKVTVSAIGSAAGPGLTEGSLLAHNVAAATIRRQRRRCTHDNAW